MSLDTFDNLKAEIIDWSHRDDMDERIDTFVALAEKEMYQNPVHILEVRSGEVLTTSTASTSSRFLALPTGFVEMRRMEIDLDGGFVELVYRAPESLRSIDGPAQPCFFTITDQIEFDTVPDDTYSINIQHIAEFVALSDSNTTNSVLTNNPNVYLFGGLKHLFHFANDQEQEARYTTLFFNAIQGANKKDQRGRFGPSPQMKVKGVTP
ncbi:MAG: hypothetical protein V3W52_17315 [Syntrophobacteria bacterium]